MRVLALDASCARCSAAVVADSHAIAERHVDSAKGHAARLPEMVGGILAETGLAPGMLDLIAVTVGPGSFTGLRTGLALAQGLSCATGIALVGVTVGESFAVALPPLGTRALWSAIDSRRGRVFLERQDGIATVALDALPYPEGPVAVAGDRAAEVAARLAARGADVMLTNVRLPAARHVALAALRHVASGRPPRPALPIYVDPPEARPPAGGLRPAPQGA